MVANNHHQRGKEKRWGQPLGHLSTRKNVAVRFFFSSKPVSAAARHILPLDSNLRFRRFESEHRAAIISGGGDPFSQPSGSSA
jgi:hypothetical protein